MTLLMIHFGHDRELVDAYQQAWVECAKSEEGKALYFGMEDEDERIKAIPELAETLRAGQLARDKWMQKARAYVEGL
jgi:hypothetical protein